MGNYDRFIDPGYYVKDGVKVPVPEFHLAGQHDQASHGNWSSGGSGGSGASGSSDFSDTFDGFVDFKGIADKNTQVKMAGATALSVIDSIHGIEKDWPKVLAMVDDGEWLGEDEGSLGAYMPPELDNPEGPIERGRVVFRATDSGGGMATTLVHEFGHHLSIGNGVEAFHAELRKAGTPLNVLYNSIKDTETFKDLARIKIAMENAPKGSVDPDQKGFVDYLMMPEELFARAYAQYISVKSNHPQMLASINESLSDEGTGGIMQWLPGDFGGVMTAMDRYLESRGLLRK